MWLYTIFSKRDSFFIMIKTNYEISIDASIIYWWSLPLYSVKDSSSKRLWQEFLQWCHISYHSYRTSLFEESLYAKWYIKPILQVAQKRRSEQIKNWVHLFHDRHMVNFVRDSHNLDNTAYPPEPLFHNADNTQKPLPFLQSFHDIIIIFNSFVITFLHVIISFWIQ